MKLLVLLLSVLCWRLSQSQITFTQPPRDIVVAIGNQARFDCTFTSSAPTSTIWQKDSDVLSPSDPRYTYLMNNSLLIDPTVSGDDGTYMCVVTNQNTLESSMQSASLTFAFFLGSFLTSPESQTVEQGAVVFFFCIHSGSLPPANITWRLNGDFIMASSRISIQTSLLEHTNGQVSSSLAIISVQRMDMGILTCTATNSFLPNSSVTSREGTLTVTAQPYPPSITRQPDDVVVQDGQDTVFVCSADGEPVPQIMWTFNNIPLTSASPQVTITSSGGVSTAAILSVGSGNVGSYQCMASNSQGDVASNVVQLSLASLGTSFLLEPPDTTAIIGQNATIDCAPPLSVPPADITWSRDLVLLSDPRSSVLENGSLLISDVDFSDQAMYYCTATNPTLGTSRTSRGAVLTTIGIPTITPAIITIPAGQSASFLCSAIGNPSPQITWYRGTNQITDDNPRVTLTDSTLTISTVSIDDRDYYTCRAVFPSGTTETNAFLNILIPPSFINSTLNVTAIPSSSSITLPCSTFTDPTITFTWFFEGDLLFPSTSDGPLVLLSNGGLVISSPQISDEGVYTCMAVNNLGTVNGTVYLDVLIAPTVSAESASVVAIRGDTVTLRCTSNGEPIPMQSWSRNGSDLSGSRYMISDDGMELSISDIMEGDMGVYTCHASNIVGSNSTTVILSVNSPPSAVATPTSLTINAGLTANFLCAATGNPVPDIVWLTGSFVDVITLGNPRIEVQPTIGGGTSLVINDVQGSDQQQYICEASNIISIDTSVVSLTVLIVPRVNISTETVAVQGNPFTLDCNPIGQPVPTVTWFRDGIEIEEDDRLAVDNNGRLTFTSILSTDAATYRCEAQNTAGMDSADTSLLVLVVPIITVTTSTVTTIQGFSAVLDCLATGDPPPTVTWFFNSAFLPNIGTPRIQQSLNNSLLISEVQTTDRGTYICQASNTAGTESASIVLIVYVIPIITPVETMVTEIVGMTTTLRCTAIGTPVPVQSWSQNGIILSDSRFQVTSNGSVLVIADVREEDQGEYTCHASNSVGSHASTVNLDIISIPSLFIPSTRVIAIQDSSAVLDCLATGDPPPTVTWFFNSTLLPNIGTPRIQQSLNNSLLISEVQTRDRGRYICQASNTAGIDAASIELIVYVIPIITPVETMVTGTVGVTTALRCTAIGTPVPVQSWSRNGIILSDSRFQVTSNGSVLMIADVREEDQGEYTCHASNSVGSHAATVNLDVISIPSLFIPSTRVIAIQDSSAVLDCLATGDPPPTVTWFFNSTFLPNIGTPRIQQSLNNSLLISEVQTTDRGTYICQASNTAGIESASIVLLVYVVPVIRALESSVTVVIGNSVTMTCIATGDPIPIQTWTRNGMAITGTRFEINDSGSTLAVTNVREEDEGLYTCHASNPASAQTDTVNLNVIVPPSFTILNNSTVIVNTPHTITCAASGDPPPSITWRFEGSVIPSTQGVLFFSPVFKENDGFYTCTASNEAGTISDQVYLDVQYIPEVVTPPTNISIPINLPAQFTCVANGNPPPSITWLLNNVSIPGAVLSTYTIAMVTASDAGTYGCVATNSIGSVYVAASLSVIFPPSPPNLLSATAISSSVIFVQWNRSANDGGSPVTGYVIEYRDTAESASTFESRLVELDVSANLDGLAPFVNYEVRVRGHNIAGPSDPSNTQTTQTHPLAPSVPINFGVLSFTPPSSLVVVWSLPDPLNGMFGAYELRYGPEDTFDDNLIERLLFTTRFTINGIQVGVVYIIQVRASTISLTGETLWGPFAILRVRDGVELEIPTTMSTSPPSTDAPSTDAPSTDAPSTDAPTTDAPSTDTPSSTAGITTESPTVSLNPPKSVPASVVALIPPETTGQILVYWMVPSPPSDDFIGYSITISPPPPPAVTTPILVPVTPISGTHVIMGLDHFTLYTVTVATYNNDGVGPQNMSSTIQTPQAAPTPPRDVQVTIINTFSILVSWSQPDPTNGVLTEYLIRVLTVTTGEEFTRKTITLPGQNVITISGLDLDNVRYSVLVSASTEAGRGPESEPIFVDDIITTTQLPSSTPTITPSPSTITRDDITTQLDITPSPQTNTTTEPRDHVYYIIRIVPPVVGPLLLVLVLVVVSLCCCTQVCIVGKRKKGLYQFSELESDYQMHLKQIPEDKEEVVPNESVKGALDSNFTFNPQSQESSEEEGNDFPDEPDIGEHISSDQVILLPYGDAMGRDALQEQEDQSHDDFMTENHTYNSDSLENQSNDGSIRYGQHKVTYQPGDYSPEELDTIRAKKAQERERRLGRQGQVQTTPPNKGRRRMQRHFNPSSGMSSGGIMETRIGEVGMSRDGKLPTVPESAAHMY